MDNKKATNEKAHMASLREKLLLLILEKNINPEYPP